MRLLIYVIIIFLSCCKSQEKLTGITDDKTSITICPEDGDCTFTVSPNTILQLLKDGTRQLYPKISKGDKTVLVFEYRRDEIEGTADSSYREQLFFEVPSDFKAISSENLNLQQYKALFARLCFCRGQTGYYKIKEGKLSINKMNDSNYNLEFHFVINEVPQVIKYIGETYSLKQ